MREPIDNMDDFTGHYIRKNKSSRTPRRMVCFDTETSQMTNSSGDIEQTFAIGVAVYQYNQGGKRDKVIKWFETESSDAMCEWIITKCHDKERLYVISANIWFDKRVSNMLPYLKQHDWVSSMLFVNGMSLIMSFKKDKKHVVFLNFQNYFRVSVKKIGKTVGLPKLDVDFDTASREDLFTYCKRDTEIIFKAMNTLFTFISDKDLGCFGYTAPSLAFNTFRHRFMDSKLLVHKNPNVTTLERAGYFGGRTECFKIGKYTKTKLIQIDINSMYPYVMKSYKYPVKLALHGKLCGNAALQHFLDTGCVVARVKINTNEPAYPCIVKTKTCFPVGKFTTVLNTPELQYALDNNHITDILEYAFFKADYVFKEYIDYFYNLRLGYKADDNIMYQDLCKLLMNSLYGKFGQKGDKILEDVEVGGNRMHRVTELHADTRKFITTTYFFGRKIVTVNKDVEGRNSIVSICSHVTAYARMMLYKSIKSIGRGNLFYTDTDCIIMYDDPDLLAKLVLSESELGAFKIEHRADKIRIYGLKDYEFAGQTKIKGVSKKAIKINENTFEQLLFPGINSELKEGLDKPYAVKHVTKTLKREYTKGTVLTNGDVIPYRFE